MVNAKGKKEDEENVIDRILNVKILENDKSAIELFGEISDK